MDSFLRQIARTYVSQTDVELIDCCFIFPNKRSGTFFLHHLAQEMKGTYVTPKVTSINEWVTAFSPLTEATRYEQLFILYNEYLKIATELAEDDKPDIPSFDQFMFWGEMLVNDFNDVDRYLVDPDKLFTNVTRFKEISSNYLTTDQISIIKRYWGEEPSASYVENFWNHIDHSHPNQRKFLKLWEILSPLYTNFKSELRRRGLSTQGMFYRNAVDRLSPITDEELEYKRYIFIGFNVLSASEWKIFSYLKNRGLADFYWDYNSPAFANPLNRATKFLKLNVEEFHSRYDIDEEPVKEFPEIEMIGVPSNIGQTKYAGEQIERWVADKVIAHPGNAIDTAIVLPDESLFIPLVHSVPTEITSMNITMGLPLRHTPIAALIHHLSVLHSHHRMSGAETTFYYEDVRTILNQPLVHTIAGEECDSMLDMLARKRMFHIPFGVISSDFPKLAPLFEPIKPTDSFAEICSIIRRIITYIKDNIGSSGNEHMNRHFLDGYLQALDTIARAAKLSTIEMRGETLFHMLSRAVATDTVNFVGQPLKGLQVMGVLETRSLDFDNLIILSMNENVFPRRHYTRSFIPDALRRGYGMATVDFQESIYAYYFYRLISRAQHVTLIYDARSVGTKTNEMSRYLTQLLYLFNQNPERRITHRLAIFSNTTFDRPVISIPKDKVVLDKLHLYTVAGSGKNLSASSIKKYVECPLEFYLSYVEGLRIDDEMADYMDSSVYGQVVHRVVENLYTQLRGDRHEVKITPEVLDSMKNNRVRIEKLITHAINELYNRLGPENDSPLNGETKVLGQVIKASVTAMLEAEKALTPFYFRKAEHKMTGQLRVSDHLAVNILQIIDRIDRLETNSQVLEEHLRFVDYKTGDESLNIKTVDELFEVDSAKWPKAIFQLLFYCNAYAQIERFNGAIEPYIYGIKTVSSSGLPPITINKNPLTDYREINPEFKSRLYDLVNEIFDPKVPFTQATDDSACKFCKFKIICGRNDNQ